jgi:fused signal recognition particle receptor
VPPIRRPGTSVLLVAGAIVLLVSIMIGQKLGDRVLLQTERRVPIGEALVTPVPEVQPTNQGPLRNWKRDQVVSVATDPAFPDPRVTRPPTPTPAPRPKPKPTPTPQPEPTIEPESAPYTSPPLPLPIASHAPDEIETEPPTLSPQERANVTNEMPATPGPR